MKLLLGQSRAGDAELAVELLLFEALATMLAEGDLDTMDQDDKAARRQLGLILAGWRAQPVRAANDLTAESRRGARPA